MAILQNTVKRTESSFSAGLMVLMIRATFSSSYGSYLKFPHHTVQSLLSSITTQKIANLQKTVKNLNSRFWKARILNSRFSLILETEKEKTKTDFKITESLRSKFKILKKQEAEFWKAEKLNAKFGRPNPDVKILAGFKILLS